ncbi:PREDICTED: iron-sulfur cluster co-chaperone protein HscB, mitochondrial isoform X1 [Tarenaya hassleriana]|uniref:iron-sulfur cluster co-chaperone protein HscB, mitochondrial isoform X1 n=1 Tax=Tarenaya hassleriana TaxID=28532 RepID=UPI00053C5A1A|nr:PREDICTED: iron-sulfur cluster co-chaperone protein HscB, mitochondrial isoform X1 [Tarenaya hassleriana]
MNRTKKLVCSISTILRHARSSNSLRDRFSARSSKTHLSWESTFTTSSLENVSRIPGKDSRLGLRLSGRIFCSESLETKNPRCWNCGFSPEGLPFLFCESCRSVQPVDDSVDYFQIFGLEKKYDIDVGSLERKYKDWQKKLHPDLVHNKSEKERDYAAEQSGKVTEAYRTLTKPLSRATYIMRLHGIYIDEEERIFDPQFLMEIMELREAIAEASDSKALNVIRLQIQEKLKHWSGSFVKAFESQKFDEAATCIQRMTYYERACEEIVKKI